MVCLTSLAPVLSVGKPGDGVHTVHSFLPESFWVAMLHSFLPLCVFLPQILTLYFSPETLLFSTRHNSKSRQELLVHCSISVNYSVCICVFGGYWRSLWKCVNVPKWDTEWWMSVCGRVSFLTVLTNRLSVS